MGTVVVPEASGHGHSHDKKKTNCCSKEAKIVTMLILVIW